MENTPLFGRLMRKIVKKMDTVEESTVDIELTHTLEEAKLRRTLETSLPTMKSSLSLDVNSHNVKNMFDGKASGTILINQYVDLLKHYNKSETVELSLNKDNIYNWIIKLRGFTKDDLQLVQTKYGYNYIELELNFHDNLYPGYPPFIRIVRPRFRNSLMHRITGLKMIQLDYWTPARGIDYVIDTLYKIFEEHGVVDTESELNDPIKYPNGAYHLLETSLVKLTSLCGIKDEYTPLDTTEYKKMYSPSSKPAASLFSKTVTEVTKSTWKAGTGYGSGSSNWDHDKYLQLKEEKDIQVKSVLQKIIEDMDSSVNNPSDTENIYNVLASSYLIPFIKSQLSGNTLLEISKHRDLFKLIFTLLQNFGTTDGVFLFGHYNNDVVDDSKNLYELIEDLQSEAIQVIKLSTTGDDADEELVDSYMICGLYEMITPIYKEYYEKTQNDRKERQQRMIAKLESSKVSANATHIEYVDVMRKEAYDMAVLKQFRYGKYTTESVADRPLIRRLAREIGALSKNLPIAYQSSVLLRVDQNDSRCMRVAITGPDDTPYDSGIYIFDVYCGRYTDKTYPNNPPLMNIINNGGKRMNPNLYNEGKVCLSLLGTWHCGKGEGWIPETSTLNQLFISVQSLILIEQPYYNEPGYERSMNTDDGNKRSRAYNMAIRYYTMCHSVCDMLESPNAYPEFKSAILAHFRLKREYILKVYEQWVNEAVDITGVTGITRAMYADKYAQIKGLLLQL
jgi:ubiquitin-protein ligase